MKAIFAMGGADFKNGEVTPIIMHIKEKTGKATPHALYLPTAGHDDITDMEPIETQFKSHGFTYSYLLLTDKTLTAEEIRSTIMHADVIFIGGGNLQFLMDTLTSTHADEYLREAYDAGTILSGSSSGAMCVFDMGWDDCGENNAFVFVRCMGILPGCFCPHFDSDSWQKFSLVVHESGMFGIGCENGALVAYENEKYSIMHGAFPADAYFFDDKNGFRQEKMLPEAIQLNNH